MGMFLLTCPPLPMLTGSSSRTSSLTLVLAFGAVYVIWGSTYLAIRIAVETIPPLLMIGARFGLAGLLMYGWLRLRGRPATSRRQWLQAAWIGTLMLGMGTGSVAWAEQYISSGLAALLVTTVPLWMVLLDWLWKGNTQPSVRLFAGLALGGFGIFLLVQPTLNADALAVGPGVIVLVLLGAFSWSATSIYAKTADRVADPFVASAMQMTGGGMALIATGLILGEGQAFDVSTITQASFVGWAYLLVFGSFIAFSAYVWLNRNVSASKVATYAYVNPVVAVLLGWWMLDEAVTLQMILAMVLLLAAVALLSLPPQTFTPARTFLRRIARTRALANTATPCPNEPC
ncbi:MAG: drug/metabolite exporter YedA [Rhodothermales bacterium]